ncbi:hypothetical protein GGR30_004611 [Martelella radicis]|uniref:Uncharacterized protein n=1 Tax=Martelella radicis TaxID=1397476 RepID=A0A7W6KNR8_9HYPH|nr:hypothetical protein [Martelella radicis]
MSLVSAMPFPGLGRLLADIDAETVDRVSVKGEF